MPNDDISLSPAFERNNVPVVIASNDLFAPYTGVFIQSLLDYAGDESNYDIIIFERDISEENKRLLKSIVARRTNISIRFYDPSPLFASFDYANEEHHFPLEVYYRIVAPHILSYPGRIITVDVDTLLKTDIARLMDEDLGGCCVGGVCDVAGVGLWRRNDTIRSINVKVQDYFLNTCGLENPEGYINGGLLLFDCEKYVQELDVETILNTAKLHRYIYEEQDILNSLMKGKIKLLNFAWNVLLPVNSRRGEIIDAGMELYNEVYGQSYEEPRMLHWAASPKPWVCPDVPYGSEWWQTALRTPFVGHIIARMTDEQEKRRAYYRKRYGAGNVDVWDPSPKGIDRTKQ